MSALRYKILLSQISSNKQRGENRSTSSAKPGFASFLRSATPLYLLQNLETLLHRGGRIVARLKEHLEDQDL